MGVQSRKRRANKVLLAITRHDGPAGFDDIAGAIDRRWVWNGWSGETLTMRPAKRRVGRAMATLAGAGKIVVLDDGRAVTRQAFNKAAGKF